MQLDQEHPRPRNADVWVVCKTARRYPFRPPKCRERGSLRDVVLADRASPALRQPTVDASRVEFVEARQEPKLDAVLEVVAADAALLAWSTRHSAEGDGARRCGNLFGAGTRRRKSNTLTGAELHRMPQRRGLRPEAPQRLQVVGRLPRAGRLGGALGLKNLPSPQLHCPKLKRHGPANSGVAAWRPDVGNRRGGGKSAERVVGVEEGCGKIVLEISRPLQQAQPEARRILGIELRLQRASQLLVWEGTAGDVVSRLGVSVGLQPPEESDVPMVNDKPSVRDQPAEVFQRTLPQPSKLGIEACAVLPPFPHCLPHGDHRRLAKGRPGEPCSGGGTGGDVAVAKRPKWTEASRDFGDHAGVQLAVHVQKLLVNHGLPQICMGLHHDRVSQPCVRRLRDAHQHVTSTDEGSPSGILVRCSRICGGMG